MIDHLYIKNYRGFQRQNIPLDKFTLLIGTHESGKTTVLDALDAFFNHNIRRDYIRDLDENVVIEVHINDQRYRKVFSPPNYNLNFDSCIGDMYDINHIKFLYVQKDINNAELLNDILSINLTEKPTHLQLQKAHKVFDYIDGVIGNSNYPLFSIQTNYKMNIPNTLTFTKEEYTKIISNITYQFLIIGIDDFELHFNPTALKEITKYSYQTIFTTNDQQIIQEFDYFIHALYKDDIKDEFETIRKQVSNNNQKTYLLVEGKYDVAWFEKALQLLGLHQQYRVIPCGGYGNIQFINAQLKKEGFETIVITDGDIGKVHALEREVIEQYADMKFLQKHFNVSFDQIPTSKYQFFKGFNVSDDIVKKVLSSWARKHLKKDSEFVQELHTILMNN